MQRYIVPKIDRTPAHKWTEQAARQTHNTRLQYAAASTGHKERIPFVSELAGLEFMFDVAHTCTNFANDNEEMAGRHLQAEVPQQRDAPRLPGKAAIVDEHCRAARGGCWGHFRVPQLLLLLAGMTTSHAKLTEMLLFCHAAYHLLLIVLLYCGVPDCGAVLRNMMFVQNMAQQILVEQTRLPASNMMRVIMCLGDLLLHC